ncbi:uncharacterized protein Dyak_GE14629 [Drosophila yakuba]|uniref:Uncharacterized protein n=1 Tax=Drosophila yakuba TaxID=7245 RepID=B4IWA1_DROYA|nr:uncharacterized protein Dyak_GE14629 [Drosophila yakuba]
MYDQMEVRYQESSLLVDQLTQSKVQLEQQVAELQEHVASKLVSNQKTSSLVEQLTQSKAQLEQQVAALQKEVASQQVANQHSGTMIKQLSDSVQNLERVNATLSEDNSVSQTARLDMSETTLKTENELKRRINRVVHLEASERRMTNELSACKREMNELKKELKSSEERIYMMKELLEKLYEQLVEKERIVKLEPPSPTPDSSTDELQMKKELTADLKEQLDNKTEENKSLQSQLQEQGFVDQLKAKFNN